MSSLENAGATWVRGGETIGRGGASLQLYGIDDPVFFGRHFLHATRLFRNELQTLARKHRQTYGPSVPLILLSHRPEFAASYSENGCDLVLSGHVHGGVWRLPRGRGLFAPGRKLLPRYSAGRYEIGSTTLIVSRGLGPATIPLRINNPPEVVLVVLRSQWRTAETPQGRQ
jgi:predicted MPP superfamily phosphohydrolase